MREKLNDSPIAQVAVLGVLALIVGFLLITRMGGGASETEAPAPAPTTATTAPDATASDATATTPGATPVTPVTPATPTTPPSGTAPATPVGDFKAGPGLPEPVVAAYDSDKVVVLLVVTKGATDDEKTKSIVESLRKRSDTELFVVEAGDVSEYSRIAQGVDLQQTPALVVLRPKQRTPKGSQPTATIEYGFRGPSSVNQSVEDALYKGPDDLPYYPQ